MNGQTEINWGEVLEAETTNTSERRQCQLGDLVELVTKGTTPSTLGGRFVDKGINFIKSEAIGYNGRIDKSTFVCIDEVTHAKLKRSQLKENDILFSMAGIYLGKNAIVTKDILPANTNQALAIIRLDKAKANVKFIHYYLKQGSVTELVNNMSGQSAQPNINFQEIRSIGILLPELDEQYAIANVLSSLDNKIDLMHRQNATLEALAETLFRQWFMEEAKEEWEVASLGDVISVKGGTTPSTKEAEFWDGDVYWTTPRDLSSHSSIFLFDTERKITKKGLAKIGSGLLPLGTVLLSSRAPIGYLAITNIPLAINQGYIAIICDKKVSNYFMYLWCKTNLEEIKSNGNGSVFQEISKSVFKELKITIPSKSILLSFDEIIKPTFEKIKNNQIQIRTLSTLRDTLLPKLMSGEVRVAY